VKINVSIFTTVVGTLMESSRKGVGHTLDDLRKHKNSSSSYSTS